jgi:hypothetical protein
VAEQPPASGPLRGRRLRQNAGSSCQLGVRTQRALDPILSPRVFGRGPGSKALLGRRVEMGPGTSEGPRAPDAFAAVGNGANDIDDQAVWQALQELRTRAEPPPSTLGESVFGASLLRAPPSHAPRLTGASPRPSVFCVLSFFLSLSLSLCLSFSPLSSLFSLLSSHVPSHLCAVHLQLTHALKG